ncbi:hypothetical protein CEP54_002979 [Fusarium duplospermum]|uniref:Uncharacterized protein n=1 Tax=Fusarium duplospermum TaxID=1325734 RepID=A0A428QRR1_9HYPO|nr:hypothetical protein CEP54_002979 [Fusarium duplospermum]
MADKRKSDDSLEKELEYEDITIQTGESSKLRREKNKERKAKEEEDKQRTQTYRRIESTRDQRERDLEPLPFRGDDPALPPVAWTQMWKDEYSNFVGGYTPDLLSEWGFVMWDEARFRDLGG